MKNSAFIETKSDIVLGKVDKIEILVILFPYSGQEISKINKHYIIHTFVFRSPILEWKYVKSKHKQDISLPGSVYRVD